MQQLNKLEPWFSDPSTMQQSKKEKQYCHVMLKHR